MNKLPQNKLPMSESQFQMWRCVIAIAHADGQIQDEERAYLGKVFSNLDRVHGLTAEQRQALTDDMGTAKKVSDILPLITEPQYRGLLIHFGETLVWADNELTVDEENVMKTLHADQMASLDLLKLRADVKKQVEKSKQQYEKEMQAIKAGAGGKSPVLRALNRVLGKLGIDLLE